MKDYSFGNYICALRMGCGLSQFQLGTLVGVTDKAVSKWENGDAKPRLGTCYRLAEVLGVTVNELLSCEHYITIPARKELDKMNQKLWKEAYEALSIYGENPPAACWSRLAAEETALQDTDAVQGFAVLGKIRKEAAARNTAIIVGGAVNSSYAAWLFGGTQVNPLPPHYICPECGKIEFSQAAEDGFDLPPKKCSCGGEFRRDGHNIPYEGYANAERLGTHMELRVSESFKPVAVEQLMDFYRGIAEVLPVKIEEEDNARCVERYVVLPENKSKPALSPDGFWHTNTNAYWQWQEKETTFTFLVNDRLNQLERLRAMTQTQLPDPWEHITEEMTEALYQERCRKIAFITRDICEKEHNFDLLMRIDLLSHATGAWAGNGSRLVRDGKAAFRDIPASREDIFLAVSRALAERRISDKGLALQVMEKTRKGLYCSQGIPVSVEKMLLSLGFPKWYPAYLKEVMYLFPKGHSVAYLAADVICQWYKIHYPKAYSACMQ